MHMGGWPSKRWRFSLDPSAAGQSVGTEAPRSALDDRDLLDGVEHLRVEVLGAVGLDLADHVHPVRDDAELPEHERQVLALGAHDDDELAAVAVGSVAGHEHLADL